MIKAIVGLGNPGEKYKKTRHNIGFMVIDKVAKRLNCGKKKEKAFSHLYECNDYDVILAKPQTYMNLSGNAVLNIMEDYNLKPEEILVIYDDLDLPLGTVKLRKNGSSGGHRGIKSIIEMIKTENFPRLRVGIGRPQSKEDVADYVLSPFDRDEELTVEKVLSHCEDCLLNVLKYGVDKAMNSCNKTVV
ncbi:MAG: aminoacyl-tRNA hydrolase [Hydrogenothermaceae bacterium]|nr:aminoacyl-tRNA hydrolase [Hydrogenothermaceae bacterium]